MTPEIFEFYMANSGLMLADKEDLKNQIYELLDIIFKIAELCHKAGINLNTLQKMVELQKLGSEDNESN